VQQKFCWVQVVHTFYQLLDLTKRNLIVMNSQSVAQGDQAIDTLFSISRILDTGLDRETLRVLVGLCEAGVNPEALALIVKELRREAAAVKAPMPEATTAAGR
jgi:mitotic-spindle organizing protein 1